MLRRIDLRGRLAAGEPPDYRRAVPRSRLDVEAAVAAVRPTVDDVRDRGLPAVLDYVARWDGVRLADVRVPVAALQEALAGLDAEVRKGFEESAHRLRLVCEAEEEPDAAVTVVPGGRVVARRVPYRRIGLYVPAGVTALASSVVMNVVPAQVAGVESIALASPPQRASGGRPHPTVLAVCALLGVEEVYAVGGVGAVAMFAYGAGPCEPVDFVAGPGRITTVAAKRCVRGVVGIDSEAGPTEIAVLADATADPVLVAADLISQAEHDPMAAGVLVTDSEPLLAGVEAELARRVPAARHADRIRAALTGEQSGVVLVDDVAQGIAVVDAYAAEHLEVQTADAAAVAARVRSAGAVFVGPYAPVSLGDYCAGSNHVLPTGGAARHSSGLSVRSFRRAMHVVEYDRTALADVAGHVYALAAAEDLPAHGAAVRARFEAG